MEPLLTSLPLCAGRGVRSCWRRDCWLRGLGVLLRGETEDPARKRGINEDEEGVALCLRLNEILTCS